MLSNIDLVTKNTLKHILQVVYNNFAHIKDVVELKQRVKNEVMDELADFNKELADNLQNENQKMAANIETIEASVQEKADLTDTNTQKVSEYVQEVSGYVQEAKENFARAQKLQRATEELQTSAAEAEKTISQTLDEFKKIRDSLSSAVIYKGSVDTYADLPVSAELGWTYNVKEADKTHQIKAGDNLVWNGKDWDNMGGFIDPDDILNGGHNAAFSDIKAKTVTANAFNGTATKAALPQGFNNEDKGTGWGNQTGTHVTGWQTANGASIEFRETSGALNAKLDGVLYQREGGKLVIDESTVNNYAPTKTGAGASGTWGINVTGNAATASLVKWENVDGKPATFAPATHNHDAAYPSTTGTRASGTWGINITGTAAAAGKINIPDTRNINKNPQQCMADSGYALNGDFKSKGTIGIGGTGTYAGLLTFAPWGDASGGYPTQIACDPGTGRMYYRWGTSATAWSGWKTVAYTDDKPTTAGTADVAKSANAVAWGNVTGRPGNATTSAAGFMAAVDKSKLNKIGNAVYTTTSTGAAKIKININAQNAWMLNFTLVLYQDYVAKKIMISGYNYGNQYWYSPSAKLIASSNDSAVSVYFGYDAVNKLWVAVDGGNYTGVAITDVCNGYQEISDYTGLFTITRIASLTGTLQTTVTPGTPIHSGNYNSYAPTKTGGGASGTWGINVTGSAGSVAWGNVTSKPTLAIVESFDASTGSLKLKTM